MDELMQKEMLEHYIAINMVNKFVDRYGQNTSKRKDSFFEDYYKMYSLALDIIRDSKKTDVELNSFDIDQMFEKDKKVDLNNPIFDK